MQKKANGKIREISDGRILLELPLSVARVIKSISLKIMTCVALIFGASTIVMGKNGASCCFELWPFFIMFVTQV